MVATTDLEEEDEANTAHKYSCSLVVAEVADRLVLQLVGLEVRNCH